MNEKIIREKTVCFTGHRSEKLPRGEALELIRKRLSLEIERALKDGYDIHAVCCNSHLFVLAARTSRSLILFL